MALFHTTVLDNQIKALPTVDTASGSIATFDTDMTENLVEVKCQIVAQQGGSGTPSPSNPRPITVYTSLNLSHSGADTSNPTVYNIPFGQTVAQGTLNVGTGKLRVTHKKANLNINWNSTNANVSGFIRFIGVFSDKATGYNIVCNMASVRPDSVVPASVSDWQISGYTNTNIYIGVDSSVLSGDLTTENGRSTAFNSWINDNGFEVYYELATPIEIQLDSITLQALLNENNIWCDTGDTSVKYILSVGKAIS